MESSDGGVAEWSIALVLKTSVPKGTQGSNPCPSDYVSVLRRGKEGVTRFGF